MSQPLIGYDRLARYLAKRPGRPADATDRKPAAVAIALVSNPDAVLLIRRADREGDRWSGQMAFPGGRWSPGDPDLLTTAIRETGEEVGVELHPCEMIGVLDDIAPRTPSLPPVIVRPFVFALPARQPLSLNHEVAAASWVELARLEQSGIYRPFEFSAGGAHLLLPGYHLEEGVVWGMTERILTPLLSLIRSADRDAKNVR